MNDFMAETWIASQNKSDSENITNYR